MIKITCDRCGVGIPRGQDASVRFDFGVKMLTSELCESCRNIVSTDLAVMFAEWAEQRASEEVSHA